MMIRKMGSLGKLARRNRCVLNDLGIVGSPARG
jgi:hypothetical protein